MKLSHSILAFGFLAAACVAIAAACSLNPQPLPPVGPDGGSGSDSGSLSNGQFGDEDGAATPTTGSDVDAGMDNGGGGGVNGEAGPGIGNDGGPDEDGGDGGASDASDDGG